MRFVFVFLLAGKDAEKGLRLARCGSETFLRDT